MSSGIGKFVVFSLAVVQAAAVLCVLCTFFWLKKRVNIYFLSRKKVGKESFVKFASQGIVVACEQAAFVCLLK